MIYDSQDYSSQLQRKLVDLRELVETIMDINTVVCICMHY